MALAEEVHARLPEGSALRSLSREELAALFAFATVRRLAKGETLYHRGDPGDSLTVVLAGALKICVTTASGREVLFDYVGTGGIVGEIAALDGEPRTATVTAVGSVELAVLQRRHLVPFLERNGAAALRIIRVLCRRLRRTDALVESNAAPAMAPKLARGLLLLADEHGIAGPHGITLPVRQSDLASYCALSRENVNRQLRAWAGEGLIALRRGAVTIREKDALDEIAEALD